MSGQEGIDRLLQAEQDATEIVAKARKGPDPPAPACIPSPCPSGWCRVPLQNWGNLGDPCASWVGTLALRGGARVS